MAENVNRRDFLGMTLGAVAVVGVGASLVAMKSSWDPLPSVVSAGFTTIDLSSMQEGEYKHTQTSSQILLQELIFHPDKSCGLLQYYDPLLKYA